MKPLAALLCIALGCACSVSSLEGEGPGEETRSSTDPSIHQSTNSADVRLSCIENRRLICGKILDIVPEGLIVESGYTNLLRQPISKSWLIPGTVQASRAENMIEGKTPGAICVGRVLLTDTPKNKKLKPTKYDYVIVQAYPSGQYTHTSAGTVQRTVRRFSANIMAAVQANLENENKPPPAK